MYEIIYQNVKDNKKYENIVKKVIEECYNEEKLDSMHLSVTLTFTTPEIIRKINKDYRNIDKATDVLSFPMFEKEEIDNRLINNNLKHEEILGDIIISVDKVEEQAKEYGHSFERELCYMIVHGFYHLMGYDHIKEEDKKMMRPKEEKILSKLNITRD